MDKEYNFMWRGHPDGYALWPEEPMRRYFKAPIAFVKPLSRPFTGGWSYDKWECIINQPGYVHTLPDIINDSWAAMKYVNKNLGLVR